MGVELDGRLSKFHRSWSDVRCAAYEHNVPAVVEQVEGTLGFPNRQRTQRGFGFPFFLEQLQGYVASKNGTQASRDPRPFGYCSTWLL